MNGISSYTEGCFFLFIRIDELEDRVKNEMEGLLSRITQSLQSKSHLAKSIENLYDDIFKIRMMAFEAMLNEDENIRDIMDDAYPFFEEMLKDDRNVNLVENILFAIRSNQRLASQIIDEENNLTTSFDGNHFTLKEAELGGLVKILQTMNFTQFVAGIQLNIPSIAATSLIEFVTVSLKMEYGILAGAMIKENNLQIDLETLEDLSSILADATQTYNAIAIELGMIKLKSSDQISKSINLTGSDFLEEQKKLSDSDFNSFAKNWD